MKVRYETLREDLNAMITDTNNERANLSLNTTGICKICKTVLTNDNEIVFCIYCGSDFCRRDIVITLQRMDRCPVCRNFLSSSLVRGINHYTDNKLKAIDPNTLSIKKHLNYIEALPATSEHEWYVKTSHRYIWIFAFVVTLVLATISFQLLKELILFQFLIMWGGSIVAIFLYGLILYILFWLYISVRKLVYGELIFDLSLTVELNTGQIKLELIGKIKKFVKWFLLKT